MDSVIIRIVRLPPHIRGYTMPDENGDYNIYISDCLNDESRVKTLRHELKHIRCGDIYSNESALQLESKMMD